MESAERAAAAPDPSSCQGPGPCPQKKPRTAGLFLFRFRTIHASIRLEPSSSIATIAIARPTLRTVHRFYTAPLKHCFREKRRQGKNTSYQTLPPGPALLSGPEVFRPSGAASRLCNRAFRETERPTACAFQSLPVLDRTGPFRTGRRRHLALRAPTLFAKGYPFRPTATGVSSGRRQARRPGSRPRRPPPPVTPPPRLIHPPLRR